MATPEGKVKALVNRVLSRYKLYKYMPVPGGFGESTLDYLVCFKGRFVAIETKAPGKKPTDRQKYVMAQMQRAGAAVFVVDGAVGAQDLDDYLKGLALNEPADLDEASDAGDPL